MPAEFTFEGVGAVLSAPVAVVDHSGHGTAAAMDGHDDDHTARAGSRFRVATPFIVTSGNAGNSVTCPTTSLQR